VHCEGAATAQVESASRANSAAHLNLHLGFLTDRRVSIMSALRAVHHHTLVSICSAVAHGLAIPGGIRQQIVPSLP